MITKSQASQLTELLGLPEAEVDDMTVVDGVSLFFEQIETMVKDAGKDYLPETPKGLRYLGIDEVAVVNGQGRYDGVLVNLETHQPITRLPSRTQEALRQSL